MAENERILKKRKGHVKELLTKSSPQALHEDLNSEDGVMAFWKNVNTGDILYMRVILVSESEIQVQLMTFMDKACYPTKIVVLLEKEDCPNARIGDYVTGVFEYVDHISKAVYLHVHEDIFDIMCLMGIINRKVSNKDLPHEHDLCICEDSKKKRMFELVQYWFNRGLEFHLKKELKDAFAAYEKSYTFNLNDIAPLLEQVSALKKLEEIIEIPKKHPKEAVCMQPENSAAVECNNNDLLMANAEKTSDSDICEDVVKVVAENAKSSKKKSANCRKHHCKQKHHRKLSNKRYRKDNRKAKHHQNVYRSAKNYQEIYRETESRHFPSHSYQSSHSYYSSYKHPLSYQQSCYPISSALNLPYQDYSPYSQFTVPFRQSYQSFPSCSQSTGSQHWPPDWSYSSCSRFTDPWHWSPDQSYPSCSQSTENPFSHQQSSASSRVPFSTERSPSLTGSPSPSHCSSRDVSPL